MSDPIRAIADAVLYEGYVLWPYRRGATKNQRRWTFGGVYPRGHSAGRADDPWTMRTECLLEGDGRVDVRVRFLHVVARRVWDGSAWVDELALGQERFVAWDEAAEREVALLGLAGDASAEIDIPAGSEREPLGGGGALERSWEALAGRVAVRRSALGNGVARLSVEIRNTTPWPGGEREEALRRTFCSTHTVLTARDARFVSQTDPPAPLHEAAGACRNEGTWPVLVEDRHTVLSSPIILEDFPRVAPESPGDLFDGGEIDLMLVLNILSMTDAEKAEMRAADPRTREILERTEALSNEQLMALHGAIREFGLAR